MVSSLSARYSSTTGGAGDMAKNHSSVWLLSTFLIMGTKREMEGAAGTDSFGGRREKGSEGLEWGESYHILSWEKYLRTRRRIYT